MKDIVEIISTLLPGVSLFHALLFFMLIITRWIVMSMTMPFLGGQILPSFVRISLAALLSALCFMMLIDEHNFVDLSIVFIALLFVKEALLGFILGFFASVIFYAYELVGELLDISRAASMSRLLVPELKHQSSAMGTLLFQLSLVVFIGLGFHRHSIQIAYESFIAFPVLSLDINVVKPDFLSYGAHVVAHLFDAAMRFALPVIVVSLLIDLAFGLMNRVAPQINAYFLSLPAKMIGGLIIIALVLPFLIDDFSTHYQSLSRFFRFFVQAQ